MSPIKRLAGPVPLPEAPNVQLPPPHPAEMPNTKQAPNPTLQAIKSILVKLYETDGNYIPNESLKNLRIKDTGLSLSSGACSDNGPAFIKPMPIESMGHMLNNSKPWELDALPEWTAEYRKTRDNNQIASGLERLFGTYLRENIDCNKPGVLYETDWRLRPRVHRLERLLYSRANGQNWQAGDLLEFSKPTQVPHIACFLVDEAPIKDSHYSKAELLCVTALMVDRIRLLSKYHSVFPVTIFSMSGRSFRVIHAYYSSNYQCLVVRKSRTLDFRVFDYSAMVLALSWMLGTPLMPKGSQTGPNVKTAAQPPMQAPTHAQEKKKKKTHWYSME